MLCQNCGKHEATTHIKKIVNGEAMQVDLCGACASKMGYSGLFPGFGLSLSDFLGSFLEEPAAVRRVTPVRCEKCGSTFEDIANSGLAGCADCYDMFRDRLAPSISRIHGKARHVGKAAQGASERRKATNRLDDLREALNRAVAAQEYEQAAKIRDEIKSLEKGADAHE